MNFGEYLVQQGRLHGSMEPRDAAKMCFQAAFGAEHGISEPEKARQWLINEMEQTEADAAAALYENISDGICRVNLAAWKARGLPADWLFSMFLSARRQEGDMERLFDRVEKLAGEGKLPFTQESWRDYAARYPLDAPRAVHHSEGYRRREKPAYRIVSREYMCLIPLLEKMAGLPGGVVAIDGRAASGKSSLAAMLVNITGAGLVCMDDFFLPPQLRGEQRLSTPGGNVHYERFADEVLPRLRSPEGFSYPRFDCSLMAMNGERAVAPSPWRIVEGSYSHHPALGEYMDIRVFRTVDAGEQRKRILLRNGEAMLRSFERAWIPMEESYFAHFRIEEKADIII